VKAVLHYGATVGLRADLGELSGPLDVVVVPEDDREGLFRALADAEVLLHVLEPVTAEMIEAAPHLRLIQKIGVGTDAIDIAAATKRGIAVCNMPGTNTQAVVEMTLLLMLMTLRRAVELDALTRAGTWLVPASIRDGLGELSGRTVGLVGYGGVPRRLAPALAALGARVVVHARRGNEDGIPVLPLDDLLAESDIVSLHLPATPETSGLIDTRRLELMRPGAILINTARGALVDQAALFDALSSGHLAAAGLDVFQPEPLGRDDPLTRLPNVVLAPHVAWLTHETLRRSLEVARENAERLASGGPLLHRVA
jgi:phosphoglycerate dehydrogenase-like enzyme